MEPNFLNLPRQVVGAVLNYVGSEDRQKFRLISKLWDQTVTDLYCATLAVHNANFESSLDCQASSIVGYFQSLTLPVPMNDAGTDFLNRLTSLSFTGIIVCYNIYPVLEQCQQLKKLEMIGCTLNEHMNEYEVNTADPSKLLPALKALKIQFPYIPCQTAQFNFLKELLPFFTSQDNNGKLNSIVLDNPNHVAGPLRIAFDKVFQKSSILSQTNRGEQIHVINGTDEGENADEFYIALLEANVKTLKNLEMADREFGSIFKLKICGENGVADPTTVQLSEFEQSLYCSHSGREFASYADLFVSVPPLLHPQIHLTKLSVIVSRTLKMDHVYTLSRKNAGTLKSLSICPTMSTERLDGFCLSPLQVLQNLNYSIIPSVYGYGGTSRVANIEEFPKSLKTFTTSETIEFVREEDFNMAAFQPLHNLDTLELLGTPYFQLGEQMVDEMDSIKIRQLIAWLPSLKKMVLRNHRDLIEDDDEDPDEDDQIPPPQFVNSLPDASTDWINNECGLSFRQDPIIPTGSPKENPALIGRYTDWYSIHFPNPRFRLHGQTTTPQFDGVIQIQPEFRKNEVLLQN